MKIPSQGTTSQRADHGASLTLDPAPLQPPSSNNPSENIPTAWRAFDRIYCISLRQRPDRRLIAESVFKQVGLLDRVEFIIVEKHPTDSEHGIYESHMQGLRAGIAASAESILVFEDDIQFDRFSPDVLANAIRFMKSNTDWHIFFFGCFVKRSRKTAFSSVLRVRYSSTAHAYVVNRQFAEQLIQLPWRGVSFDDMLRFMNDQHMYAVYPAFAFQNDSSTDNEKMHRAYRIRQFLGGMRRLQKWNEFSRRHLTTLILSHLAIVIAIITIVEYARRAR